MSRFGRGIRIASHPKGLLHPLLDADPLLDSEPDARPAAEAAAWLANPERTDQPSANMRYIEWLAQQPQWTGPLPVEQHNEEDTEA